MTQLRSTISEHHASQVAARGAAGTRRRLPPSTAVAMALLVVLAWAYWPTIFGLWKDWREDPNYSVGQLVPLVALYLLWQERARLRKCRVAPCWWGLAPLLLGQVGWFFGLLFLYGSAQRYALVLTVASLVLLVGGREIFWRLRWILVFLLLMVPLPGRIHNTISGPLQQCATISTVFVLEVFGADVGREGNTLALNDQTNVGISEACSGLRMLTAFVVVAAAFAFVVDRPRWQRATLVVSSIPIAIICNVVRLVATAALYATASSSFAERFFHDFAGLTMMPVAVAILIGELWLMKKLVTADPAPAASAKRA
jgi:exosortase